MFVTQSQTVRREPAGTKISTVGRDFYLFPSGSSGRHLISDTMCSCVNVTFKNKARRASFPVCI